MEGVTSGLAGYQALKKELRDLPMHWNHKESNTTEWLNWTEVNWVSMNNLDPHVALSCYFPLKDYYKDI